MLVVIESLPQSEEFQEVKEKNFVYTKGILYGDKMRCENLSFYEHGNSTFDLQCDEKLCGLVQSNCQKELAWWKHQPSPQAQPKDFTDLEAVE